jgi:hypothetical protein
VIKYDWTLYRVDGTKVEKVTTDICTSPHGSKTFKISDIRYRPRIKRAVDLGWIIIAGKYKLEITFTDKTGSNTYKDMAILDVGDRGDLYMKGWSLLAKVVYGVIVAGFGALLMYFAQR